jgi:hypothetical protein
MKQETATTTQGSENDGVQTVREPTPACESAFSTADVNLHAMYEKNLVDDEAEFTAILAPIFSACENPADLYAAVKNHPYVYGYTKGVPDRSTMIIYCQGNETTPACTGIESFQP